MKIVPDYRGALERVLLVYEGEAGPDAGLQHEAIKQTLSQHCQVVWYPGRPENSLEAPIPESSSQHPKRIQLGFSLLPGHRSASPPPGQINSETGKHYADEIRIEPGLDYNYILQTAAELIQNNQLLAQSRWIRDPFLVMEDRYGQAILLQSFYFQRPGDWFLTLEIAEQQALDLNLRPTRYLLEGGNVLAGKDFAIIGKDSLALNTLPFLSSKGAEKLNPALVAELQQELASLLGVEEIIWPGFDQARPDPPGSSQNSSFQPFFHLDLFMHLAGPIRSKEEGFERQLLLIGKPVSLQEFGFSDAPEVPSHLQSGVEEIITFFERYERKAAARGSCHPRFEIRLLPMPWYKDSGFHFAGTLFTHLNALIEETTAGKRIFMPNYVWDQDPTPQLSKALSAVQTSITESLHKIGIQEVIFTGEGRYMQFFAADKGALRCATQVLKRSPAVL